MNLAPLSHGPNVPHDFQVLIEISANTPGIKYEIDKETGILSVDRFLSTAMHYPCNYGYIPSTLAEDGDPLDVLVITPIPLQAGVLIRARAVGVLHMSDEAGPDAKLIAVPVQKLTPLYQTIQEIHDLPQAWIQQLTHFFEHYKDLEPGKWVKVGDFDSAQVARTLILNSIERYKEHSHAH